MLLKREAVVRRAFSGVLTLVEGARGYMSLDRLTHSSAAHALLVAAGHASHSFLWNGWTQLGGEVDGVPAGCVNDANRKMTLAHTFLMDEIARSILDGQNFNVLSWDHAFGHFAGSTKWRSFAERCKLYASRIPSNLANISSVRLLEYEVEDAYRRARNTIHQIHQRAAIEAARLSVARPNKRKLVEEEAHRSSPHAAAVMIHASDTEACTPHVAITPQLESIWHQVASVAPRPSGLWTSTGLDSRRIVC